MDQLNLFVGCSFISDSLWNYQLQYYKYSIYIDMNSIE